MADTYDGMTPTEFAQEWRDNVELLPDGITEGMAALQLMIESHRSGDLRQAYSMLDAYYVELTSIRGIPEEMGDEIYEATEGVLDAMIAVETAAKKARKFLGDALNNYPRDSEVEEAVLGRYRED